MKKFFLAALIAATPLIAVAQYDEATDNGIVNFNASKGITLSSKDGNFSFRPYALIQSTANYNWYDDEGLDKAYNQDNVANSGFAIPNAVLGFQGKAFGRVTFNLALNAAQSGGALLQHAWFDVKFKDALSIRVGKFKTPFTHAYLTTLGETALPKVPTSLTSSVIMPYSLNAVTPSFSTGFDLGVELHGMFGAAKTFGYEFGIFNGTGASTNSASKTLSDDWHIPSLLYAGRLTWQPKGAMPATQGNASQLNLDKMLLGVSANMNVESESESTNDFRAGVEWAWLKNRWYFAAEVYFMNVSFTERQKIDETYQYMGWYGQVGYFATNLDQLVVRYDFMDRNGLDANGFLNMPAVGWNHFFPKTNLKLQVMYQYMGRENHDTQLDRDNDDLGLATHSACALLQYTF